jgi:hypothetical protein
VTRSATSTRDSSQARGDGAIAGVSRGRNAALVCSTTDTLSEAERSLSSTVPSVTSDAICSV